MSPRYLLDTNIVINIRRERPPQVREHMARHRPGNLALSCISWGELLYGAMRSQHRDAAMRALDAIAETICVLPLHPDTPQHYADIRAILFQAGTPIGNNDLWIAAHARAAGLTLVSNNTREFARVEGLMLENWAQ